MKKIIATCAFIAISFSLLVAASGGGKNTTSKLDTTNYLELTGKIVDNQSKSPIVFATVFVTGTSISTVSNTDGAFLIKVPNTKKDGSISFTHLGYENKVLSIEQMVNNKGVIELKNVTVPIDEVVVRSIDPISLILSALNKISQNYSSQPEMQTSFYRETIKQNNKYVSVSEAVMDVYKSPYKTSFDFDRMKIYKGRKSRDVKKMDTILVKLQGGPKTSLLLDVVKNPGDLLSQDMLEYYDFELAGVTKIDNRETYVIKFDQKNNVKVPLYSGNIYIDTESNAFTSLNFSLSEKGLPLASKYLVKKKPSNMKINVESGHYLVRYRLEGGSWYVNYVRSELEFDSKWDKKLFKSKINIMLEMAVTDREKENIDKFTVKESAKTSDILAEQVANFEDSNFWGEYNTIKPDESIEVAIEKLNKKLKRRQE